MKKLALPLWMTNPEQLKHAKDPMQCFAKECLELSDDGVTIEWDAYQGVQKRYVTTLTFTSPNINPEPTWEEVITNFSETLGKWVKAGLPIADKETLSKRKTICIGGPNNSPCPNWQPKGLLGTGRCELCRCSKLKLYMATTQCPDNPPRWLSVSD